ncbi:transposase (plasmid) [Sphaerimonospora sp. CA-214678]|uniref:transposase n=1 Tax=Sphaerimonospora sp. CA-214678 TaxID=3240029 RepID=UPI003D8A3049
MFEKRAAGKGGDEHRSPHVLQHFLSRARWDDNAIANRWAYWAIERLGGTDTALITDETGDAKSFTDTVGAARQYSGTLGGIGLCRVAVHLSFTTPIGHTLIDRRCSRRVCGRPMRNAVSWPRFLRR